MRRLWPLAAVALLTGCASTGDRLKPGPRTRAIKRLIADLNGNASGHNFSAKAVAAGHDLLLRRTYTTISVLDGSQPLAVFPDILISDTAKDGIRIRFYAQQVSSALTQASTGFADRFINAMAAARDELWPARPPFAFSYNIHLVGGNEQVDGQLTRVFHKNDLELSFYARVHYVEKQDPHLAVMLSHETYHLMRRFYPGAMRKNQNGYSKAQMLMIEEAAAAVFGHCTGINFGGQVSLDGNLVNTFVNEGNDADRRTGSLDDQLLQQIIRPGYRISKKLARTIFGPMIFTTLWAEYAGQARTITAGSPAADKFMDLCRHNIWPPEKLIPVLQDMARDGIDPPQILPLRQQPGRSSP